VELGLETLRHAGCEVGSGLLYFLFDIAMRGLVALIALAVVISSISEASSRGVTDLRSVTMALRPRGQVPSGRRRMLLIELHERALG
jgi:hypothetical protein